MFYLLHNPLILALGVSLLLHLLLLVVPWQLTSTPPESAPLPLLSLQLHPAVFERTVSAQPAPEQHASGQIVVSGTATTPAAEMPTVSPLPAPNPLQTRSDDRAEPAFTSPPLLRLPAGTMDAISEQPLQRAPFDPRLRRQLNAVRSERPELQRDFIETGEAGSLAPQQLRVGEHCFLYSEKDALDEDSFDVWSPVTCAQ